MSYYRCNDDTTVSSIVIMNESSFLKNKNEKGSHNYNLSERMMDMRHATNTPRHIRGAGRVTG